MLRQRQWLFELPFSIPEDKDNSLFSEPKFPIQWLFETALLEFPEGNGPYKHLEGTDRTLIRSGRDFTPEQKRKIIAANKAKNGGIIKTDAPNLDPYIVLSNPIKAVSVGMGGTYLPEDMAVIDHIKPRIKGGSNSYGNARVISRTLNERLKPRKKPSKRVTIPISKKR